MVRAKRPSTGARYRRAPVPRGTARIRSPVGLRGSGPSWDCARRCIADLHIYAACGGIGLCHLATNLHAARDSLHGTTSTLAPKPPSSRGGSYSPTSASGRSAAPPRRSPSRAARPRHGARPALAPAPRPLQPLTSLLRPRRRTDRTRAREGLLRVLWRCPPGARAIVRQVSASSKQLWPRPRAPSRRPEGLRGAGTLALDGDRPCMLGARAGARAGRVLVGAARSAEPGRVRDRGGLRAGAARRSRRRLLRQRRSPRRVLAQVPRLARAGPRLRVQGAFVPGAAAAGTAAPLRDRAAVRRQSLHR